MERFSFLNSWFEEETTGEQFDELHGVIAQAYGDPYQICSHPGKPEGHVKITFVDAEEAKSKSGFREKALALLIEQLEEVQKSGVKAEEITILVRENSVAGKIAKALWERKKSDPQPGCTYDVITSDTLKIGQSQVVRFVVNFFRFFTRKEPQKVRAEILYGYYRLLRYDGMRDGNELQIDLHDLFDPGTPLPELFERWLDEDPNSEFVTGLLALPLYELAVSIVDHFELGSIVGEKLFLQAFLDMVLEYGRDDYGNCRFSGLVGGERKQQNAQSHEHSEFY